MFMILLLPFPTSKSGKREGKRRGRGEEREGEGVVGEGIVFNGVNYQQHKGKHSLCPQRWVLQC